MAITTKIEWTNRRLPGGLILPGGTANFWIGCTPVDPACAGCYAWAEDMRRNWTPEGWGKGKPRYRTKGAHDNAAAIHRRGLKAGFPAACFTNSLSDFFDEEVPDEWRDQAFDKTIIPCRGADFLILTKRAEKMREYMTRRFPAGLINVWLGVTAADRKGAAQRIPELLATPAVRRFISYEPALEMVPWEDYLAGGGVHWLIAGGESENPLHPHKARPAAKAWMEHARIVCWQAGVSFFFKQWGEHAPLCEIMDAQAAAMCQKPDVVPPVHVDGETVFKVGKNLAGHMLNGRAILEMPKFQRPVLACAA